MIKGKIQDFGKRGASRNSEEKKTSASMSNEKEGGGEVDFCGTP